MKLKAYDGHGEDEILALDERGNAAYVPTDLAGYFERPKETRTWQHQVQTSFHPSRAGHNDPLSVMLVLDTLMRIRPSDMIRAKYLVGLLRQLHPHLIWNTVTVGHILGELSELAEEAFEDTERRPLIQKRDFQSNFWQITVTADAWKWFSSLRTLIGKLNADSLARELRGEDVRRDTSVWSQIEWRA